MRLGTVYYPILDDLPRPWKDYETLPEDYVIGRNGRFNDNLSWLCFWGYIQIRYIGCVEDEIQRVGCRVTLGEYGGIRCSECHFSRRLFSEVFNTLPADSRDGGLFGFKLTEEGLAFLDAERERRRTVSIVHAAPGSSVALAAVAVPVTAPEPSKSRGNGGRPKVDRGAFVLSKRHLRRLDVSGVEVSGEWVSGKKAFDACGLGKDTLRRYRAGMPQVAVLGGVFVVDVHGRVTFKKNDDKRGVVWYFRGTCNPVDSSFREFWYVD